MANIITPIIVALDFSDKQDALKIAKKIDPKLCRVKVGKELFTSYGPNIVFELHDLGFEVFLDLKFHDIPTTCAKAITAAANLGVWMVNVHLSGGLEMLKACKTALNYASHKPLLIGVTVLTSMEQKDLVQIGINNSPINQVLTLAKLAKQADFDGLVCSAQEAEILKQEFAHFKLVTPGIRPANNNLVNKINFNNLENSAHEKQNAELNSTKIKTMTFDTHLKNNTQEDQKRIFTPFDAINAGSDYLVIGRPITQSPNPKEALKQIIAQII